MPSNQEVAPPNARAEGLVIYVEDNPSNVRVMQNLIGALPGVEMLTAKTAEEGVMLIRRHLLDVVLMDLNLPGMSGIEALQLLKSDPTTTAIPVVAVTAAAMPQDIAVGNAQGFAAHVTKPFNVRELISLVRKLL